MPIDQVRSSVVGTNSEVQTQRNDNYTDDPSLAPQRHAGAVGLGPNYPLGPSLGDKLEGIGEEIKGKILRKPELVEQGRERRSGELMRKERERNNAVDPFKASR